jgi:uncharacterized protein YjiS (DUF1127 family)
MAALLNQRCTYLRQKSINAARVKDDQEKFKRKNKMNLVRSYNNWRRYRETVSELSRLTSRELNDLGISRGDITFVARKAAA